MSRFTDLFQPKNPESKPVAEEPIKNEVVSKPIDKVLEINKWRYKKSK